jgi:FAD/FMN-containing dehydrogenase
MALREPAEQELVWGVRRDGLSLLTGCVGAAKPAAGIEDGCVRPRDLPAFVAGLQEILDRLGLATSYYGHAASGEPVRPTLTCTRRGCREAVKGRRPGR